MPTPRKTPPRGLPENVRRKLEVATAMAWEALVETHVSEATSFINLLADRLPLEEALTRYLREMDLTETMGTAIRTRVLLTMEHHGQEEDEDEDADADAPGAQPGAARPAGAAPEEDSPGGIEALFPTSEAWRRFMPDAVVRGVRERARRQEELERIIMLSLARSEEALIRTHVENAIAFAALFGEHLSMDRAIQQYLGAVGLTGCRGQVVFQRTMARLADVHLPA